MARLLARQKPAWVPGTRHGHHTMTLGLYMQELIRRVDPAHRTLGRCFHDEIAVPLGLEFYIGLPQARPPQARAHGLLRLESTRVRRSRRRRLVRVRRSRCAPGLRLRDEQAGFPLGERSAGEGAARRGLPRDGVGALTVQSQWVASTICTLSVSCERLSY